MQLTGAEIIIECLKEQKVDTVFGYPGGAILNVYDALYKHSDEIQHILTSHEQGAGIVMPITKHSFIVKDITMLADTLRKAFYIAKSGRPGPVLVDVTKDVTAATYEYSVRRPATINREVETIRKEDLETAAQMIEEAKKPYIFVGGGSVISGASKEISELAHKIQAPVCDSLMGKGAFSGEDP